MDGRFRSRSQSREFDDIRVYFYHYDCQSALNNDPPSASKFDPPWS